jgi:shikimate kinase
LFQRRGNKMDRKLILTGFMATGKSAVARALARRLDWPLFDTDRELASAAGKSVAAIFGEEGEAHFRQIERDLIEKLSNDPAPAVIATGGGALLDDRNHKVLLRCGVIVCLTARPEIIAMRIGRSAEIRPKLLELGKSLNDRIAELLAERHKAYARAAFSIDTSDISVEETARRVLEGFAQHGGQQCLRSA